MNNIFPIRFYAYDPYGWAQCPAPSKDIWMRIRKNVAPNLTWYATSFELINPNSIRLFVHEMADNFSGGIGRIIHEELVTEFTEQEKKIIDKIILDEYTKKADDELVRRETKEREEKVLAIRKEMFGV